MSLIGKAALYILTACALLATANTVVRHARGRTARCVYFQFAQSRDSTHWQADCERPAMPDTTR